MSKFSLKSAIRGCCTSARCKIRHVAPACPKSLMNVVPAMLAACVNASMAPFKTWPKYLLEQQMKLFSAGNGFQPACNCCCCNERPAYLNLLRGSMSSISHACEPECRLDAPTSHQDGRSKPCRHSIHGELSFLLCLLGKAFLIIVL